MRTVTVVLTFDIGNDQNVDLNGIKGYVETINDVLSEKFPASQPQLILDETINIKILGLTL